MMAEKSLLDVLSNHLRRLGYEDALVERVVPLGEQEVTAVRELKQYGYGKPLRVDFHSQGRVHTVVLRTAKPDIFGHDRLSDRAQMMLLSHHTFNDIPHHVRSLDVGAIARDGSLVSLADAEEFYILTEYVPGRLYAEDLLRLRDGGDLRRVDVARAEALARYLVDLHSEKRDEPHVYLRHVRDTVGHSEGIFGLTDSYPRDFPLAPPRRLQAIEQAAVAWRWRMKQYTHRLSRTHGDFHPFNVLFRQGTDFTLLDRSRGGWGDPADDICCMAINYLFFSLQRFAGLRDPFATLWYRFWETYLEGTGDEELLEVTGGYFAWRALVVASPLWYPNLTPRTRQALLAFAENVLAAERFDPYRVEDYLPTSEQWDASP